MLHPIFSVLVSRPELLVDHVAGYAALARDELRHRHRHAAEERELMMRPPWVKSMARPRSCIDVPGRAVGGLQLLLRRRVTHVDGDIVGAAIPFLGRTLPTLLAELDQALALLPNVETRLSTAVMLNGRGPSSGAGLSIRATASKNVISCAYSTGTA